MAEIYGEAFVETARDKIVSLLTSLKSTMASGYDPTFSYIYEKHSTAKILLNAVTVDLESVTQEDIEWETSVLVQYRLVFSLRVHTAYNGRYSDGQKQSRLLNSIANKLKANYDLGDEYRLDRIDDISVNQYFDETDTYGGSLNAEVLVIIRHTQE